MGFFMPFLLTAAVWCVPSSHFGAVGFSINYKSKKQKHWKLSPAAAPGHTCPLHGFSEGPGDTD